MNARTIARTVLRLTSTAVVTGVATLAVAAPAGAVLPKDPPPQPACCADDGFTGDPGGTVNYGAIVGATLAGIGMAGAGIATVAGKRRQRSTRPV